jgi:hypothetical protein
VEVPLGRVLAEFVNKPVVPRAMRGKAAQLRG